MALMKNQEKRFFSIGQRLHFQKNHPVWRSQYRAFIAAISQLPLPPDSTALSVSCGDGMWDFLAFSSNSCLTTIIATDVVDCPVAEADVQLLNKNNHTWSFQKIAPDTFWPIAGNSVELAFHQDVLEHTRHPYLFVNENHRVLKPGGYLVFGTPNLFRPANLIKLVCGRLHFPRQLGVSQQLGPVIHQQEFHEYQLVNLMQEAGFTIVSVRHCFAGLSFLNLNFRDFPVSRWGKNLCQYLFLVARKAGHSKNLP